MPENDGYNLNTSNDKNSFILELELNKKKEQYRPPKINSDEQTQAETNIADEKAKNKRTGTRDEEAEINSDEQTTNKREGIKNRALNTVKNIGDAIPNPARGIRNISRRRKILKRIKKIDKEIKLINKDVSKLKKKIWIAKKSAALADAIKSIIAYVSAMVPIWWWTIIGALIDIFMVIPTIFIIYWLGLKKGIIGKQADLLLKKTKKEIGGKEKRKKEISKKKMVYYQQMAQRTVPK